MHTALSRPNLISLAAGFTDNESLPVAAVRELLGQTLRSSRTGQPALQYGSTQGDPALRAFTSAHLHRIDGCPESAKPYDAGRMIVTNGSQQMLYMVTEALCDPGDIVLVEDPTYFVYLGILQSHGIHARGVQMDADGINLGCLETVLESLKKSRQLSRVKALYLVTYFQNPTGVTTSFEKKAAALRLLKRYEKDAGHPIYLLEDAAYRELRFSGKDEPTALSIRGAADRVIYAGTFSKPFATGTRVGFGLLPEPVFTAVMRIKGNHDFGTSNLLQQLLAKALKSGAYRTHLRDLRKRYAGKAAVMAEAFRKHLPESVRWTEPQGGLYFWARTPVELATGMDSKLFQSALKNDVLYVPGSLCYANDPSRKKPDNEMRISFGSASEKNIRNGVKRLGAALAV